MLLALSPNQFASAHQNPKSMQESSMNEPVLNYYAEDGLDSKDLVERPANDRREEMLEMDREDYIQPDEELEDEGQDYMSAPAREGGAKMKRWLWSKKQSKGGQKSGKSAWMFQTGAMEGLAVSVAPAEQGPHLRNRAVDLPRAKAVHSAYDQAADTQYQ